MIFFSKVAIRFLTKQLNFFIILLGQKIANNDSDSKYRQTDFAGEKFGYDGEENGHDEEDVGGADLRRSRKFVRSTTNLVHVKADRENQRGQTKQDHANEGDPTSVLRDSSMPVGGDEENASRRQTTDAQNDENQSTCPFCR